MQLNELFDKPYPYKWVERSEEMWKAKAKLADGGLLTVNFNPVMFDGSEWEINFQRDDDPEFKATGTGDEFKIFSTVVAVIKDWWAQQSKTRHPNEPIRAIEFDAWKNENVAASRAKLYTRFAKQFANKLKMQLKINDTPSSINFELRRPKKKKVSEVEIDNRNGRGAVPNNMEVDYFGMRVNMKPSTFLKLAAPLSSDANDEMKNYIKQGGAIGAPFLIVDVPEDLSKDIPTIKGHEGRNRMKAVKAVEGDAPVEVHLFFRGAINRARHLTDEIAKLLKAGAYQERTNRHVPGPLWEDGRIVKGVNTTADVKPGETQRQAAKFGNKLNKKGEPPLLNAKANKNSDPHTLSNLGLAESKNIDVHAFAKALETKYNLKSLFLSDLAARNAIEVSNIIVNKDAQKQGTGTAVMKEIVNFAEKNGRILVLDPAIVDKKHGTTSQSRLRKFYKRFGFIENKGRNKNYQFRQLMIRYPENKLSESQQLNELFNQPYNWKWGHNPNIALFITEDGGEIVVAFSKLHTDSPNYEVSFAKNDSIKKTGEGDQFKIIATVITIIKAFIQKNPNTNVLTFTAKREGKAAESPKYKNNRAELYKRMLSRFATKNGFEFAYDDIGRMTEFVLRRKKTTNESRQLNELFDERYNWNWERPNKATFKTSNNSRVVAVFGNIGNKDEGQYHFDFSRGGSERVTGEGDAVKIFSTIIGIVGDFIQRNDPNLIVFTAEKNPNRDANTNSRIKLYNRLVKTFASKAGYDAKIIPDNWQSRYVLRKKDMTEDMAIQKPHPDDTLGVARKDMPQVHRNHYPELLRYLKSHGASMHKGEVQAKKLKATQGEFSDEGIRKMMKKGGVTGDGTKKPLLVSSDNYIIDGHHRWLAAYNTDENVPILQFSIPVKKLLQLVNDFKYTTYKDIYEADVKKSKLDVPTPDIKTIAKKHNVSLKVITAQLKKGITIEKEHTTDAAVAKEIALDHLNEFPDYYDRLEKVEENLSVIGTRNSKQERKKKLIPGTEAWFKYWFSRPYLKREDVNRLKEEAVNYIKGVRNEKETKRQRSNRNRGTNECGRNG